MSNRDRIIEYYFTEQSIKIDAESITHQLRSKKYADFDKNFNLYDWKPRIKLKTPWEPLKIYKMTTLNNFEIIKFLSLFLVQCRESLPIDGVKVTTSLKMNWTLDNVSFNLDKSNSYSIQIFINDFLLIRY